ncbi:MAG: hypothetical protein MJ200_04580 [Mycoplasmoidaceae bacterium]|nr:hypothetical protein [Mycoplasmoidaceae bacterium]
MKKNKKIKLIPILIPCLSVAAVSAVAIPMSVLETKHHVLIDFKQLDIGFASDTYTYTFSLKENLKKGQSILVTTKKSKFYNFINWLEPVSFDPIVTENKTFTVEMKFKSLEKTRTNGPGGIDVYFKCIDANKHVV